MKTLWNDDALQTAAPTPAPAPPAGAHVYKHGYSVITGMYGPTQREETYTRFTDGHQTQENCFCTGPADRSPRQTGNYNPACSPCYLGFTHSQDEHNKNTAAAASAEAVKINTARAMVPTTEEPDIDTLMSWMNSPTEANEATDGCIVEPDGICEHGYPSWLLELGLI